jgi:hypothetical protein
MIGNVSTNAITPVLFKKKFKIDFEKEVQSVTRFNIYPSFLDHHDELRREGRQGLVAQAKKNPARCATPARRRLLPALRHGNLRAAAGVDMIHIPNKTGAAGMLNDLVVGDAQVAFSTRRARRR